MGVFSRMHGDSENFPKQLGLTSRHCILRMLAQVTKRNFVRWPNISLQSNWTRSVWQGRKILLATRNAGLQEMMIAQGVSPPLKHSKRKKTNARTNILCPLLSY